MFKKLVSNLPFNPSLISHLRDYDLRLKRDLKLRLNAVLILTLVVLIQVIVIVIPPRNTTTYSPNNLLSNANGSVNRLFNDCLTNSDQYQSILSFYNINCNQLYYGKTVDLSLNSSGNDLFSLNRLSYDPKNEAVVVIYGQKFYIRSLVFSNELQTKSLSVWELNLNSKTYYIEPNSGDIISSKQTLINNQLEQICTQKQLYSCFSFSLSVRAINSGNLDANNTTVSAGSGLVYTLSATNKSNYKISNFRFDINLQNALAYSNIVNTYGGINQNGIVSYRLNSVLPYQTQTEIIATKVKSSIPSNSISSSDPDYYAQKMITSFGNTVVVFVPKTVNKFYEININNYLPSTNSRNSMVILVVILLITIYLLLRTIVMREEIKIIRHEHSSHEERPKK